MSPLTMNLSFNLTADSDRTVWNMVVWGFQFEAHLYILCYIILTWRVLNLYICSKCGGCASNWESLKFLYGNMYGFWNNHVSHCLPTVWQQQSEGKFLIPDRGKYPYYLSYISGNFNSDLIHFLTQNSLTSQIKA